MIAVKLRDHPLIKHPGGKNWPPVWTQRRIDGVKAVTGEEDGILIDVHAATDSSRCDLIVQYENEDYTGTLLFDEPKFCHQLAALLRQHIGKSIKEIGDSEVSFTPT
jgi:hypothetical protein